MFLGIVRTADRLYTHELCPTSDSSTFTNEEDEVIATIDYAGGLFRAHGVWVGSFHMRPDEDGRLVWCLSAELVGVNVLFMTTHADLLEAERALFPVLLENGMV